MTTINTKYPFIGCIETRQGGRNENQDNGGFVDTPLGLLLVVCDGMGGGPGGRTASHTAVESILNLLSEVAPHTHRKDALQFAIEKANDILYMKAKETPELRGMGTTVAAILINEDSALIAHVGDSRIYQLRKGTVVYRSADHSYVAELVRQKKITEEEARNHPQSNVITRALGIRPQIEIAFDEVTFLTGDRFVLCSDGIWGMLPQNKLLKQLTRVMGIENLTALVCEEIDDIGKENGGEHDNMTLAMLDVTFDSVRKDVKRGRWLKRLLFALLCCTISAIASYWLLYADWSSTSKTPRAEQIGKVTTTVDYGGARQSNVDDSIEQIETVEPVEIVHEESGDINPFLSQNLNNDVKKEMARLVEKVKRNLDGLQKIKGMNKKDGQKKRRKFVSTMISPDVQRIGNKFAQDCDNDIKTIIDMLKDDKTVLCSKNGKPHAESQKQIDKIKSKLEVLLCKQQP